MSGEYVILWKSSCTRRVFQTHCRALTAQDALRIFHRDAFALRAERRIPRNITLDIVGICDPSWVDAASDEMPRGICMHLVETF